MLHQTVCLSLNLNHSIKQYVEQKRDEQEHIMCSAETASARLLHVRLAIRVAPRERGTALGLHRCLQCCRVKCGHSRCVCSRVHVRMPLAWCTVIAACHVRREVCRSCAHSRAWQDARSHAVRVLRSEICLALHACVCFGSPRKSQSCASRHCCARCCVADLSTSAFDTVTRLEVACAWHDAHAKSSHS